MRHLWDYITSGTITAEINLMIRSVFLALALLGVPLGYAAPLASPFSLAVFPAQSFTATGQTGAAIQLNGLTVPSTVGSSFWSGTITVTGTSLTTATFGVLGSSDGGATYYPLPIQSPLAAVPSTPVTTATVTVNGIYQVSLAGITHVEFVTSGTFTATALSITLTASPNAGVSRNNGSGGSFTPPSGAGNLAYMTPDGTSGSAALRHILASDLPTIAVFGVSTNGLAPASGSPVGHFLKDDGTWATPAGSVASGVQGQPAGYAATGSALAPLPKIFYLNSGMTLTQINAVFSAADNNSVVIVGQGVPQYNWNNVNNAQVKDLRKGADWLYPAAYNVPCDSHYEFLTISSGANTLTVPSGVVGQTLFIGYQTGLTYQAPQYTWFPTIASMAGSVATLSGHAPFAFSGWVTVGTDATAASQAMLNASSFIFPVRLPTQCRPVVQTLTWKSNNFAGQNQITSQFIGVPAQDILTAPSSLSTSQGLTVTNMGLALDESVDLTIGTLVSYDPTGVTPTSVPPIYRPLLNNTQNANKQISDQWVTGGSNGVASITAGSAVICVPTALGRTAPNSINIVFPYLPIAQLFSTTVLNQTGAGCAGGNIGVTLNAALPAGTTATQAYWMAGTAFETGETTIPTVINYPLTITVSLPTAPDPAGTMAGHGHVILGNGSVRLEADYLGNNYNATPGSGTITLRRGPGTITSALTAGAYTIIATNPCPAKFETPPPVVPNLNAGDTTPSGAVDIPGGCGGNGAITFPTPDALSISTGITSALIDNVMVTSTPNSFQGANSSIGVYGAGDATGYSSAFRKLNLEGVQFGFAQGPAAKNNWNISSVGPTSSGMALEDCQIHAAFPIILTNFQDGKISRCDTYTDYINPYDGTNIGPGTALAIGFTTNEQTGGSVTITRDILVDTWYSEPHTGNGAEHTAYADIRGSSITFLNDNFEGTLLIFAGSDITVEHTNYGLPVINYGFSVNFINTTSTSSSYYMTNNWADNNTQFFNWGRNSTCQTRHGGGGPSMNCGVGFYQAWEGHSLDSSMTGNDASPFENVLGGQILMSERGNVGPVLFDSTEPYWGAYNTCPGITFCIWDQLDGPFGNMFVGPHNRLAALPYTLIMRVRSPGGANTFDIQFVTTDDGHGHCGSTGNFGYVANNPTTSTWTIVEVPVDLTGKQGCHLSWQTQQYLSAGEFDFGEINFAPDVHSTKYSVPSDSIYNTSCRVPGKEYGTSATGYKYVCVAGTIKRFGPAS